MAEIWLAHKSGPVGFEKLFVIKKIRPHLANQKSFIQMFINEARLAAQLNHPNIVQIYDLEKVDQTYFIAMEYIFGRDLSEICSKVNESKDFFPLEYATQIILQASEGLYYAHTKTSSSGSPLDIVHRDISPHNVLVSFDGNVKILDFGIAKAANQYQQTQHGVLKGKVSYMAPEQILGNPFDARADLFSLGSVFYELVTGYRLFTGENDIAILRSITDSPIQPPSYFNPNVPPDLEAIMLRILDKDPETRYPDAWELQQDLSLLLKRFRFTPTNVHLAKFLKELFADEMQAEEQYLQKKIREKKLPPVESSPELQAVQEIYDSTSDLSEDAEEGDPFKTVYTQHHRSQYREKTQNSQEILPAYSEDYASGEIESLSEYEAILPDEVHQLEKIEDFSGSIHQLEKIEDLPSIQSSPIQRTHSSESLPISSDSPSSEVIYFSPVPIDPLVSIHDTRICHTPVPDLPPSEQTQPDLNIKDLEDSDLDSDSGSDSLTPETAPNLRSIKSMGPESTPSLQDQQKLKKETSQLKFSDKEDREKKIISQGIKSSENNSPPKQGFISDEELPHADDSPSPTMPELPLVKELEMPFPEPSSSDIYMSLRLPAQIYHQLNSIAEERRSQVEQEVQCIIQKAVLAYLAKDKADSSRELTINKIPK